MGNLFDRACKYSIEKHSNQLRKDGSLYILHPFEVATIASTMTSDEEVLAAAVLHDTVEDTDSTFDDINELFGDKIANLVKKETENQYPDLTKEESWILRKKEAITKLKETNDINFKIIYLSDKLANIRSLYRDYDNNGMKAFDRFNVKDISIQGWYYNELLSCFKELENYDAYKEFKEKIDYVFKEMRELKWKRK